MSRMSVASPGMAVRIALFCLCLGFGSYGSGLAHDAQETGADDQILIEAAARDKVLLLGVGDSLSQGTMDAANNKANTQKAFMNQVWSKLRKAGRKVIFVQPFLSDTGHRLNPNKVPTNLGVDGEDMFSLVGLEYGKRVGSPTNDHGPQYWCDKAEPHLLTGMHDKVLYPINLRAGEPVTQLDALIWHLNNRAAGVPAIVCFWVGNNDSGLAALGLGGRNPEFLPIPYTQIKSKLDYSLQFLLDYGLNNGEVSFSPFSPDNVSRNLTDEVDFIAQYDHVMLRLNSEADLTNADIFLCTFPYYCDVGYLFDRADLAYYLSGGGYQVPEFGGRVSLLTFFCMYALQKTGETQAMDQILQQEHDLVLSLTDSREYQTIKSRIDAFNRIAKTQPGVHFIKTGKKLNSLFNKGLNVDGTKLFRSWGRGGSFSIDGVHPGHTVHAHIANIVLKRMNQKLKIKAPLHDLGPIMKKDPYVDHDGDGWVKGPAGEGVGRTRILYLLRDADGDTGTDPDGKAEIDYLTTDEIWKLVSDSLLEEIIDIPAIRAEAERIGVWPIKK
ncbi:MAG: hypothetical protein WBB73_05115 [Candidatus Aminicenantaceae bacterium]